jgi:hypothetical protein
VGGSSVRRAKNSIRSIKISASNGRISCRAKLTARHKLSPRRLRIKCFKGDKQIRRFLANEVKSRVQIALNLNTDAVPSLITERRDSGWTASVLTTAVDSLIEYQKITRRRSSQIR